LLEDLRTIIPHHKKDSKLDAKKSGGDSTGKAVNDIAEITGCNTALFLECRKHQDAYLWIGLTRNSSAQSVNTSSSHGGPSAKFLVENVHTMDELRLTGNSMKGSRPILSFDTSFDTLTHLKILKCLFTDVFGTPRGHPKSKPFVDRVMGFYYADGKVCFMNPQNMSMV
jgi:ribosome biogenesis protein BRX1